MLKPKTAFIALLTPALLAGCSVSNKQSSIPGMKVGKRNQRFINDISLAGNARSHIKTNIPQSHIAKNEERRRLAADENARLNNIPEAKDFSINDPLRTKYADLLGVIPKSVTNAPLYSFIDTWYGVPYRLGGNDMSGIDCSAFVQRLYEHVFATNVVRTALEQFNVCRMVDNIDELREGDLVFFHTNTYGRRRRGKKAKITGHRISHVGVYLANNHFVHASTTYGVMISSLQEEYWAKKFAGAGQIPKLSKL